VAARHILGVVLAVDKQRAPLEARVGLDQTQFRSDHCGVLLGDLSLRVEELEGHGEEGRVATRRLPQAPFVLPLKAVTPKPFLATRGWIPAKLK